MKIFKTKFLLVVSLLTFVCSTNNVNAQVKFTEPISPGVTREEHVVNYGNKNAVVNLLKIDLSNPYTELEVVAGAGKYTKKATVSQMASRTDAVALVNGDFFNTLLQGSPEGPSMVNGKLQTSPVRYYGLYSLGISNQNKAYIEEIKFSGNVKAPNGKTYPIDGLNKSYYWYEGTNEYSHQNKIQLYNDFWASASRGEKTNTEILVNGNGVVEQISVGKNFPFPVPDGKYILQVDGTAYDFFNQNVKIGSKISINYSISPNHNFKFLVGGHALLVENGQIKKYTKDVNVLGGVRARTAAGISKDGKTLYIAAAEGRTSRSAGLSLNSLSQFMVDTGSYKALNLDGGGSTAMVLKHLGENERDRVINPEKNAGERKVVSGIGIYNKAPASNKIGGVKMDGPSTIIVGQSAQYTLKSMYNEFLKPMSVSGVDYYMSHDRSEAGQWYNNYFMAMTPGKTNVTLTTGSGFSTTKEVDIKGFDYVKSLKSSVDKAIVEPGMTINVSTSAVLPNSKSVPISPTVLKYNIEGFDGTFDKNGNLTIKSFNGNHSATITVTAGDKTSVINIYDSTAKILKMKLNNSSYSVNFENKKMDSKPFAKDNRTFVPIRFVVEALGGNVDWNQELQTIKITSGNNTLELKLNSDQLIKNGESIQMDTKPLVKNNRTFIPIRFVAESLGMNVDYNNSTKEITITNK